MKRWKYLALAAAMVLVGCGGGDGNDDDPQVAQLTARFEAVSEGPARRALAVPAGTDPLQAANRLFDFIESQTQYRWLFPRHEATRHMGGWWYRYYPQTGVYMAVIDWRVYVLGGPIGTEIRDVGAVENYISLAQNQPPAVALKPSATSVEVGGTLIIEAAATDSDGAVNKVEFFMNGQKVYELASPPYAVSWRPTTPGTYTISARATDDQGASADSTSLSVTVTAAPTQVPSLSDLYGRVTFTYTYGLPFTDVVDFAPVNVYAGTLVAPLASNASTVISCQVNPGSMYGFRYFCLTILASGASDLFLFNLNNGTVTGRYGFCPASSSRTDCVTGLNKPPFFTLSGNVRRNGASVLLLPDSSAANHAEDAKAGWAAAAARPSSTDSSQDEAHAEVAQFLHRLQQNLLSIR